MITSKVITWRLPSDHRLLEMAAKCRKNLSEQPMSHHSEYHSTCCHVKVQTVELKAATIHPNKLYLTILSLSMKFLKLDA